MFRVTDVSVTAFAQNCRSILEIDLAQCRGITSPSVTALLSNLSHLRELRLAHCEEITDSAFLDLSPRLHFDSLRILDLTACEQVRDDAIARIIPAAPRLRNLVLAKCRNITDRAVNSICKLTKNLHYIHLGHCTNITDAAVINLVKACNRIRYIDLACCGRLTDASVTQLAQLPKLRRIGLVKCQQLTDRSIIALARGPLIFSPSGRVTGASPHYCSLERVHLSYCINLSLKVRKSCSPSHGTHLTSFIGHHCTAYQLSTSYPLVTHWCRRFLETRSHALLPRCSSRVHSSTTRCVLRLFWGGSSEIARIPQPSRA